MEPDFLNSLRVESRAAMQAMINALSWLLVNLTLANLDLQQTL